MVDTCCDKFSIPIIGIVDLIFLTLVPRSDISVSKSTATAPCFVASGTNFAPSSSDPFRAINKSPAISARLSREMPFMAV